MSARKAIYNQLKTGSITRVYNREGGVTNPTPPYVVLWKESPIVQNVIEQGLYTFRIACHVAKTEVDTLDLYIESEIWDLLHKVQLQDPDNSEFFDTYVTREISSATLNDDKTLSRDILIQAPAP